MSVIAIASELAGDGDIIARHIAARLGLSFLDHGNILERLAQHGFSLSEFAHLSGRGRPPLEKSWQLQKIGKIISSEILFLAQKSSMMLHSPYAPYLLAGIDQIPRIQVRTPAMRRARNYAHENKCDEAQAFLRLRSHDEREAFILETYFGVDTPGRAEHFDLVADTGWLGTADWVEQIFDLVRDPDFEPNSASRTKLRALAVETARPSVASAADSGYSSACC